ncbi:N-acetyltransferase family protein [Virgibacillus ndiopensis]|uniref:GNAT family N-acetyltransferase n=1 Tax=Virgibacillus ndiopensis TaxID=2004408 RepID=UPI003CCBA5A6
MIREVGVDEAEQLLELTKRVDSESAYMLYEPGERRLTVDKQQKMIEVFKNEQNSTILVAEQDNRLIGYLFAVGGKVQRKKHVAYLVIGILSDYRGKCVGTALFSEADKWARKKGLSRLELTVVVKNEAGLALYKKAGFEIEGVKKHSLIINGDFFNEYYMGKLLG